MVFQSEHTFSDIMNERLKKTQDAIDGLTCADLAKLSEEEEIKNKIESLIKENRDSLVIPELGEPKKKESAGKISWEVPFTGSPDFFSYKATTLKDVSALHHNIKIDSEHHVMTIDLGAATNVDDAEKRAGLQLVAIERTLSSLRELLNTEFSAEVFRKKAESRFRKRKQNCGELQSKGYLSAAS